MSVNLVLGYNGGGKTTLTEERFKGYYRINRDIIGGKLKNIHFALEKAFKAGYTDIVMDNTFVDRESRKDVIEICKKYKVECNCVWLDATIEDAQVNVCTRMFQKYGKILSPEEIKSSKDPNVFPISVLYSYRKRFEKPVKDEGFSNIHHVKFERFKDNKYCNKALFLDYDGTLRKSIGPKDWPEDPSHVEVLPGRKEKLQEYLSKGYLLLGVSNQSAIAKGTLTCQNAERCFQRTNELLGIEIDFMYCPHKVPPISCYCRKPGPAMGVHFIERYKLNPSECIMVGDQKTDQTFAERCGFKYFDQEEFFK